MGQIESRRQYTDGKIRELQGRLEQAACRCSGKACVYATGSYGRHEAGEFSDLDAFIAGRVAAGERLLSRVEEIRVKADLITAVEEAGLPPFDGDGEYLEFYLVDDLVKRLGTPQDDSLNTFTARLLLLLESTCLVGMDIYKEAIDEVLTFYWRDFDHHKTDFVPAFLANDILRLWRTLCINYEARTSQEPPERRARRRLKNYTLKHSRLLTCYSAILQLLAVHAAAGTVTLEDAKQMAAASPTERISQVRERFPKDSEERRSCDAILAAYEQFLETTARRKDELIKAFLADAAPQLLGGREGMERLGAAVGDAISAIGNGGRFQRLLTV